MLELFLDSLQAITMAAYALVFCFLILSFFPFLLITKKGQHARAESAGDIVFGFWRFVFGCTINFVYWYLAYAYLRSGMLVISTEGGSISTPVELKLLLLIAILALACSRPGLC